MADEFTISVSVEYDDGESTSFVAGVTDHQENISSKKFIHGKVSVGTSEEAFSLGEVTTAGGFYVIKNLDYTNYVEARSASGAGNDIGKILPGGIMVGRWGSDVSAPYVIADTAACQVEYWFWSA